MINSILKNLMLVPALLTIGGVTSLLRAADAPAMPPSVKVDGQALQLNGVGVREATIFKVHVYQAGLYLPKPNSDSGQILNSTQPKAVRLAFVHQVTQEQMRDAWRDSFKKNCGDQCDALQPQFGQLLSRLTAAKPGDVDVYIFLKDGLEVMHNGKLLAQINDPKLNPVILSSWIGNAPPNKSLRTGMLGLEKKTG